MSSSEESSVGEEKAECPIRSKSMHMIGTFHKDVNDDNEEVLYQISDVGTWTYNGRLDAVVFRRRFNVTCCHVHSAYIY